MRHRGFLKLIAALFALQIVCGCEQIMKVLGQCEGDCESTQQNRRGSKTSGLSDDDENQTVAKSERRADGSVAVKMIARSSSSQVLSAEDGSEIEGASVSIPPNGLMIDTEIAIAEGAELNRSEVFIALKINQANAGAAGKPVAAIASNNAQLSEPMTLNIPLPDEGSQLVGAANYVVLYHAYDAKLKQSKIGFVPTSDVKIDDRYAQIQSMEFGIYQAMRVFEPVLEKRAVEVTFEPTIERKSYSDDERAELIPVTKDSPQTTDSTPTDTTSPIAGTWNAATSASLTGFTLNWTAATDNATPASQLLYYVCSSASPTSIGTVAGCEQATQVRNYTAALTSQVITGLTPNTRRHFNIIVKDAAGNKTIFSATQADTLGDSAPPTVGTFSASTNVTSTGFTLNWTAASDNYDAASSLQYVVCEGSSLSMIDTIAECDNVNQVIGSGYVADQRSLSISSRSIGATYHFNVVVKDSSGNRAIYAGKSQTTSSDATLPSPGVFSISTNLTANGLQLNWTAGSDNVTTISNLSYAVCKGTLSTQVESVSSCKANQVGGYQANITSNTLTGLNPATTYYFNVLIKDEAGNENIYASRMDTTLAQASVISITSLKVDGAYKVGDQIDIDVTFNRSVYFTGSPSLTLETGSIDRSAVYFSGNGTTVLTFRYTVDTGDTSSDLDVVSASALVGTIKDSDAILINSTLPTPGTSLSLGASKQIVIDTSAPVAPSAVSWNKSTPTKFTSFKALWTKSTSSDVSRQDIQFFTAANCSTSFANTSINVGSSSVEEFSTNGSDSITYSFKVISFDAAGNSASSACSSHLAVDTTAPSAASSLGWAAKGANDPDNRLTASWTSSGDATSQQIQFFSDASCATPLGGASAVSGMEASKSYPRDFEASGTYTFKVISLDEAGNETQSVCSPSQTLTVLTCPTNYVKISPNSELGMSQSFCVMKYEAKITGVENGQSAYEPSMSPESRAAGTPWVNLTRDQAVAECQSLGTGYQLISNVQWQAVAREIELAQVTGVRPNWDGGSTTNSRINRGNSQTTNTLAASSTDQNGCDGVTTELNCGASGWHELKRTHVVSTGQAVVWDFAGNAAEWIDNASNAKSGPPGIVSVFVFTLMNDSPASSTKSDWLPQQVYSSMNSNGGLGKLFFSPLYTGMVRGGDFDDSSSAGIFHANLSVDANSASASVGFRCVYNGGNNGT